MIRPTMYSGLSGRKIIARANISTGPTSQFCTSESPSTLLVAENVGQLLVSHLGKGRIHHQDQADGNRNVGCADLEAVDETLDARHEKTETHAQGHGSKDPDRQIAVQKREFFGYGTHDAVTAEPSLISPRLRSVLADIVEFFLQLNLSSFSSEGSQTD